jgi:cytochrome c oxidase subunit II
MRGRVGSSVAVLAAAPLLLTGCGDKTQNALAPESHQARDIASLFWWMMAGAWIGLAVVVGLLLLAWKRRNRRGFGRDTEGEQAGERLGWIVVVGAGIVVPIVLLVTLFVVSDLFVVKTTQAPAATATKRTVLVIGHQWWWEARYPGTSVVTANEIHIPVRTPVRLEVRTDDVIHSFWVPQLNRKIDTLPGQTSAIELYADAAGRYRGQCAEFCGLQHAHMGVYVFADPPAKFAAWLAEQSSPAVTGQDEFLDHCASCHTIRGTSASGDVGPDLTHVASRTTLGGLTLENDDRDDLRAWIRDSQQFKPGNKMPSFTQLPASQLDAIVAYLEQLK